MHYTFKAYRSITWQVSNGRERWQPATLGEHAAHDGGRAAPQLALPSSHRLMAGVLGIFFLLILSPCGAWAASGLEATVLWRTCHGAARCEVVCAAAEHGKLFATTADGVDQLVAATGAKAAFLTSPEGFHASSVACCNGCLAVAWVAEDKQLRGQIGCYDVETGAQVALWEAGYMPDMVVFSPDGRYLLAANEGEPTDDYQFDPEASITLVDLAGGCQAARVQQLGFRQFNGSREQLRRQGVRVCGPSQVHPDGQATVAEDLEPECIAVSENCRQAWVVLQENNALAEIDLPGGRVLSVTPLGTKNFRHVSDSLIQQRTTGLDASDLDGGTKVRCWPVFGLYQPDGIATFEHAGSTFLITANEGDPRDYPGYADHCPAAELTSHGQQFDRSLNARLLLNPDQMGRLDISLACGDTDADGDIDELHCFGGRSFAVWQLRAAEAPRLTFDSGNDFEQITAREAAERYNANSYPGSAPDERSALRGPEPESVVVGQIGPRRMAMIGLERTGGIMIYDLTMPTYPEFVRYLPPLDQDGILDCAPEGLLLIPAEQSPTRNPLLVVCNEGSGTTTAYQLQWHDQSVASAR